MKAITYILLTLILTNSCALPQFSFKSAGKGVQKEIPAKTIQIDFFENNTSLASSTVSSSFTESLRDLMQAQTSLMLVSENGEVVFTGSISEYLISPVNIQAGSETAAQNRLTMSVSVDEYFPIIDSSALNNKKFSAFVDYNSDDDFSSIEESLIESLNKQLTQDIFDNSFGGQW